MSAPDDGRSAPMRTLRFPMTREDARSLRAGESILVDGEITITAGLPTVQRLADCARDHRDPPIALTGGSLLHLGSYSRDTAEGGLEILYMNPTTSTRFNALMPGLIRHFGLTAVGAIRAVRQVAYPDLVAHYRLVRLAVEGLGPLTVGIDADGNSLFDTLQQQAAARMPGILARLAADRAASS